MVLTSSFYCLPQESERDCQMADGDGGVPSQRRGDANDAVSTGHTLTGPTKAYHCFGYDLYWLQLVHRLPEPVIDRLRDFHTFQGARYEILVAAIFARASCEIEWIDDNKASGKHPEFIATHKVTGKKVGVENEESATPRSNELHRYGLARNTSQRRRF